MKTKNIVISGWYGVPNCGDEALLDVFCAQLSRRLDISVTVLSARASGLQATYGDIPVTGVQHGFLLGKRSIFFWLKGRVIPLLLSIFKADMLVVGGGSLLRDAGSKGNLFRTLDEVFIAGILGKSVCTYTVGIGPFIYHKSNDLVVRALKYCRYISVRDRKSAGLIAQASNDLAKIEVVPDPGLLLEPLSFLPDNLNSVSDFLSLAPEKTVFIYPVELDELPSGVSEERGLQLMSESLSILARQFSLRFVFIPYQSTGSNNDIVIAEKIIENLEGEVDTLILRQVPTPREAVTLVSLPVLNLAIRLHSFIFCVSQQVPVIALNYQHKIQNVAKEFGLGHCVLEINERLPQLLVEQVSLSINQPDTNKMKNQELYDAQNRLHKMFDSFASILNGKH